jgi:Na+(H+)/acetate symporter ActP
MWLTWLVPGGLALGVVASALAGLRGLPTGQRDTGVGGRRRIAVALVASAGLLTSVVPLGSGVVLLLALGLAASTLGPAAVLACWSERATPHSTAGGASVGALTFVLLAAVAVSTRGSLSEGWGSIDVAAPAAFAALIHLLAAWLLRSRSIASPRSPLPPGLERLSDGLPARSRAG